MLCGWAEDIRRGRRRWSHYPREWSTRIYVLNGLRTYIAGHAHEAFVEDVVPDRESQVRVVMLDIVLRLVLPPQPNELRTPLLGASAGLIIESY